MSRLTCGDPITEEKFHNMVMAASYWKQQFDKLSQHISDCGNQIDLEELQKKLKEESSF
jgi:hypothetical protein